MTLMAASAQDTRRFAFVLWIVLLGSIILYGVVMRIIPAGEGPNEVLNYALLGLSAVLAVFAIAARLRRQDESSPEQFRRFLLLGCVLAEAAALMGVVTHIVTGWPYAWALLGIGGAAHLAQFPTPSA